MQNQWLVAVVALTCLSSCVGVSRIRYSKPSVEDQRVTTRGERGVGDMFVLGDLAFHVVPMNGKSADLLLFPVPLPTAESKGVSRSFLIGVALRSEAPGLMVDVGKILFWRDPAMVASASKIQGPYPCDSSKGPPPTRSLPIAPIALERGACTFVWLYFDVAPPDPRESFVVKIDGVTADGLIADVPPVTFRLAKRVDTFAVP